jgi:predicted N-acetyltransferase YhbS
MTSDLPLRPITPEDFAACFAMSADAFGEDPREDDRERERSVFELDRSVAAFDGARPVATAAFFTTSIRVPGGELACPVVTWVAVARGYRRRGLLGGMMGRLLDDARERGEPLAALFASEASIYGRYGFGSASTS